MSTLTLCQRTAASEAAGGKNPPKTTNHFLNKYPPNFFFCPLAPVLYLDLRCPDSWSSTVRCQNLEQQERVLITHTCWNILHSDANERENGGPATSPALLHHHTRPPCGRIIGRPLANLLSWRCQSVSRQVRSGGEEAAAAAAAAASTCFQTQPLYCCGPSLSVHLCV